MKKIGLIGGLGPESTLDYYREIIGYFNVNHSGKIYPEMIIYSANINDLSPLVVEGRWADLTAWILERIAFLHRAGAEFAAICSNTPHRVFEEVQAESPLPLVSIVEATRDEAVRRGLKNIGLIGTKLTMETDFYKKPFLARNISVVVPSGDDRRFIHKMIFSELELGIFNETTRAEFLAIVEKMVDQSNIDGLVLGCTELPLILTKDAFGIPFLNTTAIHCRRIIEFCLSGQGRSDGH